MKAFKITVAALLIAAMVCILAACAAKPSGTYEGTLASITFKGNKITYKLGNLELNGTFKMDGENINITWDEGEGGKEFKVATWDKKDDEIVVGEGILSTIYKKK